MRGDRMMLQLGSVESDDTPPESQVVKCVVVGDNGVGKTRLISQRACGTKYTLNQLMSTHVPTVWAIDHYRNDKEVLKRSWCVVDGMSVSLQLWDTFGYHDKDRRFAYGRADVIVVCFSAVRPRSLKSVINHWHPEVLRHCPQTPVILCATQIDLRYLYNDPKFTELDKGPFFRQIHDEDILPPEKGRTVAKDIGAWYYETSVLDSSGIQGLFTNIIRGALIHKRDKHFWNMLGGLKRISAPKCEPPQKPPKPECPEFKFPEESTELDVHCLWNNSVHYDVVFEVSGASIRAHKACLITASSQFQELFQLYDSQMGSNCAGVSTDDVRLCSLCSIVHPILGCCPVPCPLDHGVKDGVVVADSPRHLSEDTALLLKDKYSQSLDSQDSFLNPPVYGAKTAKFSDKFQSLFPVFTSIRHQPADNHTTESGQTRQLIIIQVEPKIRPQVFNEIINFCYTGKLLLRESSMEFLTELRDVSEVMGLRDLVRMVDNVGCDEGFMNLEVEERVREERRSRRKELLIERNLAADVVFELDDGCVSAHKALLMAACDVMVPMFTYNFTENASSHVRFPGVSTVTFQSLLHYLYTGELSVGNTDKLELVALANRLCLSRLLAVIQREIIAELEISDQSGRDICEEVILLLEPSQLHNATALAAWCQWFLCIQYSEVYRRYSKLIMSLRPDNQVYLSKHRWPPVWYLREVDFYEKYLVDQERKKHQRSFAPHVSFEESDQGCLGFCARRNRRMRNTSVPLTA